MDTLLIETAYEPATVGASVLLELQPACTDSRPGDQPPAKARISTTAPDEVDS